MEVQTECGNLSKSKGERESVSKKSVSGSNSDNESKRKITNESNSGM